MDWAQVLAILGVNVAIMGTFIGISIQLFVWSRAETREDVKRVEKILESNRREAKDVIDAIQMEIKDFHKTLYSLEEKKK